jgi:phosphopantothenoylcysteine synthetase/decarboxylase
MPELTLVVCGAPLASRADEVRDALSRHWSVSVVVSEAARQWSSIPASVERPRPDALLACPLTFNSANKIVAGVMDTPATGALCDAVGAGVPVVGVPMVNDRLWGHPAWASPLQRLGEAGVRLIDVRSGERGARAVASGAGAEVVRAFQPRWVVDALG